MFVIQRHCVYCDVLKEHVLFRCNFCFRELKEAHIKIMWFRRRMNIQYKLVREINDVINP